MHLPKLRIVWEKGLELPRFEMPNEAKVFAKDRWTGAPLLAGFRRGAGAVLWVAVSPGERGYQRFPYLLHALADLGLDPPFHSTASGLSSTPPTACAWISTTSPRAGAPPASTPCTSPPGTSTIRTPSATLTSSASSPPATPTAYWFTPGSNCPTSAKNSGTIIPSGAKKPAVLQDAQLDWRKLMNLFNPDCFRAAAAGVKDLIGRFDWDGVNLAELYFESLEGLSNPSRFTPMNDNVRAQFRTAGGFDPIELFQTRKDAPSATRLSGLPRRLAREMQQQWLAEIESIRHARNYLDIVLTHVDDRLDTSMRDAIGADSAQLLPLLEHHNFTFLIEDPATVWNEAPQRYEEIARRYRPLTPRQDRLAIDLNIVDRYQNVYPTKQQTGAELFEVVHSAAGAFAQVALYFENSILSPDLPLLPAAAAVVTRAEAIGPKLMIESPQGVALRWPGPALVDGLPWPVRNDEFLFLPAGAHSVEAGAESPALRVTQFNGELTSAQLVSANAIEMAYRSTARAIVLLNRRARECRDRRCPKPARSGRPECHLPAARPALSNDRSQKIVTSGFCLLTSVFCLRLISPAHTPRSSSGPANRAASPPA